MLSSNCTALFNGHHWPVTAALLSTKRRPFIKHHTDYVWPCYLAGAVSNGLAHDANQKIIEARSRQHDSGRACWRQYMHAGRLGAHSTYGRPQALTIGHRVTSSSARAAASAPVTANPTRHGSTSPAQFHHKYNAYSISVTDTADQ